ncbi:hypothetical protein [Burkholderia sp. HI2500]|uniref:hypothetical protein n=1 Tax=Burkholderia sp. HI2500 TaxID=2015358 RepID=UPI0011801DB3|nr:hypothetical protein [Burkholderia sp. HI2500]
MGAIDPDQISVNSRAGEYRAARFSARLCGMSPPFPSGERHTQAKNEGMRYVPIIRFNGRANAKMKNGRPWRPPVS